MGATRRYRRRLQGRRQPKPSMMSPQEAVALVEHEIEAERARAGGPPAPAPITPATRERLARHKADLLDPAVTRQEDLDRIHNEFRDWVDTLPADEADAGHQALNEFIDGVSRGRPRREASPSRPLDDYSPAVAAILDEAMSADEPYWNVKLIHSDPQGPCDAPGCLEHHEPRKPGDSTHADFGYTHGLFERYGLPELHCPAYPAATVAEGFGLPYRAIGEILNATAARAIAGELTAGSTFELTSRSGDHQFHMNFLLGQPVERDQVSAYYADPAATVVPITWVVDRVDCAHEGHR